jgi:hypothetical protein
MRRVHFMRPPFVPSMQDMKRSFMSRRPLHRGASLRTQSVAIRLKIDEGGKRVTGVYYNQEGSLAEPCDVPQNTRGGLFFVVDDKSLAVGVRNFMDSESLNVTTVRNPSKRRRKVHR